MDKDKFVSDVSESLLVKKLMFQDEKEEPEKNLADRKDDDISVLFPGVPGFGSLWLPRKDIDV